MIYRLFLPITLFTQIETLICSKKHQKKVLSHSHFPDIHGIPFDTDIPHLGPSHAATWRMPTMTRLSPSALTSACSMIVSRWLPWLLSEIMRRSHLHLCLRVRQQTLGCPPIRDFTCSKIPCGAPPLKPCSYDRGQLILRLSIQRPMCYK